MTTFDVRLRVRYAETDKMGVVYHGNYAQYFEIGRTEWLRNLGISYKNMEDQGIMLPVVNLNVNYKKSAYYDQELCIRTTLIQASGVKIIFDYQILDNEGEIITTANSVLVFVDMKTKRPCRIPDYISEKLPI